MGKAVAASSYSVDGSGYMEKQPPCRAGLPAPRWALEQHSSRAVLAAAFPGFAADTAVDLWVKQRQQEGLLHELLLLLIACNLPMLSTQPSHRYRFLLTLSSAADL